MLNNQAKLKNQCDNTRLLQHHFEQSLLRGAQEKEVGNGFLLETALGFGCPKPWFDPPKPCFGATKKKKAGNGFLLEIALGFGCPKPWFDLPQTLLLGPPNPALGTAAGRSVCTDNTGRFRPGTLSCREVFSKNALVCLIETATLIGQTPVPPSPFSGLSSMPGRHSRPRKAWRDPTKLSS